MYRRRNQKQVQPEQKVEEKKVEKKEEPVIKYVVQPRGDLPSIGKAPMINTLRNINYFNLTATPDKYSVPAQWILETLLSKGYLNANYDYYNKDPSGTAYTGISSWKDLYKNTTNFKRSTFAPGDLIMFETNNTVDGNSVNTNLSVGFLISNVYKAQASEFAPESQLDYSPPIKLEDRSEGDTKFNVLMSSLTLYLNMYVTPLQSVKLGDVREYCSYSQQPQNDDGDYEKLRKLEPTNMSVYDKRNPLYPASYQSVEPREADPAYMPPANTSTVFTRPVTPDSGSEGQFNLLSGSIVDGWLIYMYTTSNALTADAAITKDGVATITGDVIKTEKVSITTIGNKILSIGNVFQIPYDAVSNTYNIKYSGNATKFASEPLNSEQYQLKYGDTVGERIITAKTMGIWSLKKCCGDLQE